MVWVRALAGYLYIYVTIFLRLTKKEKRKIKRGSSPAFVKCSLSEGGSDYEIKGVNYVMTVAKQLCVSMLLTNNLVFFCVCFQISEGAECIMINKRFFLMNASITTLVQLKALVCTS